MITAYDQDVFLTYAQNLSDEEDVDGDAVELGDEEESESEEEDVDEEDMEEAG